MKKQLVWVFGVLCAVHAFAWSLMVGNDSISSSGLFSDQKWVNDTYYFTSVNHGTAYVVRGESAAFLYLEDIELSDPATNWSEWYYTVSGNICFIGSSRADTSESLHIILKGQNLISGEGIRTQYCSMLAIHGPGSLSMVGDDDNHPYISTGGDFWIGEGTVLQITGNFLDTAGSGLSAGGTLAILNSAVSLVQAGLSHGLSSIKANDLAITDSVLSICSSVANPAYLLTKAIDVKNQVAIKYSSVTVLGTVGGIMAKSCYMDTSAVGILAGPIPVIQAEELIIDNTIGLMISEADGITVNKQLYRSGNNLTIIGGKSCCAIKGYATDSIMNSGFLEIFRHEGGNTTIFAPDGVGIEQHKFYWEHSEGTGVTRQLQCEVSGGKLAISHDPDWKDVRKFFTAASIAATAETVLQGAVSGEITLSMLENFFASEALAGASGLLAQQLSSAKPIRGICADFVCFSGGITTVDCQTDANGVVSVVYPAKISGGSIRINGKPWGTSSVKLESLSISGPAAVSSEGQGAYICTATYSDGFSCEVTPTWSLSSGSSYGSISTAGVFTAKATTTDRSVTIKAVFEDKSTTKTVTVTAAAPQTVTFDGNGGTSETQTQSYTRGGTYGSLPKATWAGHAAFFGWWTAASGGTQVTESSTVTMDETRTLYAHWTDKQVTTYSGNGGMPETQTRTNTIGKAYGVFPTVAWTNHALTGWTTTSGAWVYETNLVTDAVARTLVAQWTTNQTVIFDANGGTCSVEKKGYFIGTTYASLPSASWAGHALVGWYTAKSGGTQVKVGDRVPELAGRTLYAHWTGTQVTTYSGNGGTPGTQTRTNSIGKAYGPFPAVAWTNHALTGWTTTSGTWVYETNLVTEAAARTLVAQWTTNQTVTFDANGGTCSVEKKGYFIGTTYASLPSATWAGHAMLGWYTERNGGTQVKVGDRVPELAGRTLYAHWTDKQVTTYSGNGGTPGTQTRTNAIGKAYGTFPVVTWTNHALTGWATTGGTWVYETNLVTAAAGRTLVAQWTTNQTVTFDANGGTCSVEKKGYFIGTTYASLPSATWAGHAMLGWYTERNGGTQVKVGDRVPELAGRTLYAHWTDKQVTTYSGNGGTPGAQTRTNGIGKAYGAFPVVTWTNHALTGWTTTSGTWVYETNLVTEAAARTLVAQWTTNQTVTFDANGGTCSVEKRGYFIGMTYASLPSATWAGHAMVGWYTERNGGTQVKVGDRVPELAGRTLYAHWTDKQVTTYSGNGGAPGTQTRTNAIGKAYGTFPVVTWTNHALMGWTTTSGAWVYETNLVTEAAARTLVAQWTTNQTVIFDANGGTCSVEKRGYFIGTTYASLPSATWAGHAMVGWYTERNGGTQVKVGDRVPELAGRTLYAHWTGTQVTTYSGNGGTPGTQTRTNGIGKAYGAFPVVTWTNHALTGWTTTSGTWVYETNLVTEAAARTLVAQWTTNQTVTFDANGGTCIVEKKGYFIGTTYASLPSATWAGHAMVGWYTAKSGGTQVKMGDRVPELAGRTLYAHWTGTQVTTYSGNGGTPGTQTRTNSIGKAYGTFPAVSWTNHALTGWATTGGAWVYETNLVTAAAERTLVAQWTTNQTVIFDANGGTCSVEKRGYFIGTTYASLPSATWAGYALAGWYTENRRGVQVKVGDRVPELASRTLYAHWTREQWVTFEAHGGSCATAKQRFWVAETYSNLPSATWAKHAFLGWWTGETNGSRVTTGSKVTAATERTLHAHWTTQQKVTFDANGGNPEIQGRTNTIGEVYGAFPAVSWTNHALAGWATTGGAWVHETNLVTEAAARTLVAQWTTNQTVTFDPNGGTCGVEKKGYFVGTAYASLPSATWEGHALLGWYTEKRGGVQVKAGDRVPELAKRTLHAHWTTTQTVTFHANGGTCGVDTARYVVGGTYPDLPTPEKGAVPFVGWFTSASGGVQVSDGTRIPELAELILYAHWARNQTVTFDANGGTCGVEKKGYWAPGTYGTLPAASWPGREFLGWWTEREGGEKVSAGDATGEAASRTLWAHWGGVQDGTWRIQGFSMMGGTGKWRLALEVSAGTEYVVEWAPALNGQWTELKRWVSTASGTVEVEVSTPAGAGAGFLRVASGTLGDAGRWRIAGFSRGTGGKWRLTVETEAGVEYAVEWAAALDGKWTELERKAAGTDGVSEVEVATPAGASAGFYRLAVTGKRRR